ncbi:MAG: YlmC/YmxH family sporulation protein [Clostridium sp.]|uniref:YlmC/YmxH family sporulation protein n=1 Tax=Clostridium sp. TaxID=1506 RepID=UPI002FCBDBB1
MSKRLSEITNLEIINIYNGEKYGFIGECDMIFSRDNGELIGLEAYESKSSFFSFKDSGNIFLPWTAKMKVCDRTLIFDHKI